MYCNAFFYLIAQLRNTWASRMEFEGRAGAALELGAGLKGGGAFILLIQGQLLIMQSEHAAMLQEPPALTSCIFTPRTQRNVARAKLDARGRLASNLYY